MILDSTVIETTFPIYNRLDKQARYHPGYKGEIAPLISPNNRILAFQFRRSARNMETFKIHTTNPNAVFKAICLETAVETNLLSWFQDKHTMLNLPVEQADYCLYRGTYLLDANLGTGHYYLVISDGLDTWYSEIFHVFSCGEQEEGDYRIYGQSDDTRIYGDDKERIYN